MSSLTMTIGTERSRFLSCHDAWFQMGRMALHLQMLMLFCCLFPLDFSAALSLDTTESLLFTRRKFGVVGGALLSLHGVDQTNLALAVESPSPLLPGGVAAYKPQGAPGSSQWRTPKVHTKLAETRLLANELLPLQQPLFDRQQDLYYPSFMFGAWKVTATLKRKIYPYGPGYLPSTSLLGGSPRNREEKVGDTTTYEVHYFSADPNGPPSIKIIQDRAFSAASISKAYKQLTPVQSVNWDYRQNPTKVLLDFGTGLLDQDMRPLGPRRTEIFINARTAEDANDSIHFATAERTRSVTLASRDGVVADTETITEFTKASHDQVQAWSRIAVYLTPNPNSREGVLWQQTQGKAVAFFDYELDMRRIQDIAPGEDESTTSRTCVKTPQDVVQCA